MAHLVAQSVHPVLYPSYRGRSASLDLDVKPRQTSGYKTLIEEVSVARKKLQINDVFDARPPPGYTFLGIGHSAITEYCKEDSRLRGVAVNNVSVGKSGHTSYTSFRQNDNRDEMFSVGANISRHIHRLGYHFRSDIFENACYNLQYAVHNGKLRKIAGKSHAAQGTATMRTPSTGTGGDTPASSDNEEADTVIGAIKEVFPRIPEVAALKIYREAWKKGSGRVGTANRPLAETVQLAVVAHIRHTYTDYDRLLSRIGWGNARATVKDGVLKKLVEWRGENDTEKGIEDILREIIIIDDEDEEFALAHRDPLAALQPPRKRQRRNENESNDAADARPKDVTRRGTQYEARSAQVGSQVRRIPNDDVTNQIRRVQALSLSDRRAIHHEWEQAQAAQRSTALQKSNVPYNHPDLRTATRLALPVDGYGQTPMVFELGGVRYTRSVSRAVSPPQRHESTIANPLDQHNVYLSPYMDGDRLPRRNARRVDMPQDACVVDLTAPSPAKQAVLPGRVSYNAVPSRRLITHEEHEEIARKRKRSESQASSSDPSEMEESSETEDSRMSWLQRSNVWQRTTARLRSFVR